ncbi:MAG: flagellar hook-associated protein FlgK [Chitinispirillales bacterium]|jgi:flagellar hook-associated protein 1 FlgK|nr:flagellar hook-associated protein FlgK [Chitinispirillales bacterium]
MTLFSILSVGTRALQTSQLGIDITGQNVSNADVDGYSRKRINQATMYCYDSTYGQMGLGAQVINIERMRNVFLDEQIRKQNSEVGYFAQVNSTFNRMEAILCEPSDLGIMHYLDEFFDSWDNLANNPKDISARTMVRTNAQMMIDNFHKAAAELANLREQKNEEIPVHVARINQISFEVMNLNKEVAAVEIGNQNANDSRDRREVLLKELSQLIDITVVENEMGQVTVTTCGNVLVAPSYMQNLVTTTVSRELDDGTIIRDMGIRFSDTRMDFMPAGGQLRGLIDSRDIYIPEYQAKLDEFAAAIIKTINDVHVRGYNLMGHSGFKFFDDAVEIRTDDRTGLKYEVPKYNKAATIKLAPDIFSDVQNIAAASEQQSISRGIPLTVKPSVSNTTAQVTIDSAGIGVPHQFYTGTAPILDTAPVKVFTSNGVELTRGTDYNVNEATGEITLLNPTYANYRLDISFKIQNQVGKDPLYNYGMDPVQLVRDDDETTPARNIIANSVTVRVVTKNGIPLSPSDPDRLVLKEGVDYAIDYTFGTFQMLHNGYDGEEFSIDFKYYLGGFKGPDDNTTAIAISQLRNALTMTPDGIGNNTATFTEYFSSLEGRLGLNTLQSDSNLQTRIFLTEQYETQQESISGVSLDEEMANLIRYQHTYTAAARLITTVDQMLEVLLNM